MQDFSIVIPVYDETQALSFSRYYFDGLGVQPIYALDSKRIHRREEVEALLGRRVAIYDNPGPCIEAHYERLAALSPSDWVLRIDCDEVPNMAMLDYCRKFVRHPSDAYCGFDRDDLRWRDERFERLVYAPLFVDSQFRLFHRGRVKFVSRIHTPGFHVPKWKLPYLPFWNAPSAARLYHLQRVFSSPQQREEKATRYNRAGQSAGFDAWNARADDSFKWRPMRDEAFRITFQRWLQQNPA